MIGHNTKNFVYINKCTYVLLFSSRYSPNQEGIATHEEAEYNYGDSDSDETLDYESD
jgi:hypothetical protein